MAVNNKLLDNLEISSSWTFSSDKSLKNTLSLDYSNESVDLEDIVRLDTCIHLFENKDNKSACTVSITLPDATSHFISQIVIVSEARTIELFGQYEEYIETTSATYIDDFENCAVYRADTDFQPTNHLLLKFQKTKHADQLWLYGIHLKLIMKSKQQSSSGIDYQRVNEMLKEAKLPISDNAEKCKIFLQNYYKCKLPFQSNSLDPKVLIKMFESEYLNTFKERSQPITDSVASGSCTLNGNKEIIKNVSDVSDTGNWTQESVATDLKCYIDQRITQLEKRIDRFEQKVEEIEIRQNKKLDFIIELLRKTKPNNVL